VTLVVAIDGPAGAGKSTLARRLAADLGWAYLDTGAMYRAATLRALEQGIGLDDEEGLAALAATLDLDVAAGGLVRVDGRDVTAGIRTPEVTAAVSAVARVPEVRAVMVGHQRRFAARHGRVVAEGRDIGTVVFPDAAVKVWLDADPGERARRRLREERPGGRDPGTDPEAVERVQAALERRDRLDRTREVAPLEPARDAWRLDTTGMTLAEVFEAVRSHVRSRIPIGREPGSST
jgi:cytidylate kinase